MGWEPFFLRGGGGKGRLIMAYKNVPIGMDVGFHLRAPKFKWSQLQDAPSCSKGGIRGWWEGVKGFRRRGGGEGVGGGCWWWKYWPPPATHWVAPHLKRQTRSGVP